MEDKNLRENYKRVEGLLSALRKAKKTMIKEKNYADLYGVCHESVDDKISGIFSSLPQVMRIQDQNGETLPMECAKLGLEGACMLALEDESSLIQNWEGENLGMLILVHGGMREACLKALDNHQAILQKDDHGCDMMFYAISHFSPEISEKGRMLRRAVRENKLDELQPEN